MAKSFRFALAGLLLLPFAASADLLVVPPGSADAPAIDKPDKGMSMAQVVAKYGEPTNRLPPVGGGSKFQPPITRWEYPQFSVVFENSHVIDAVVPDQPPPITPSEELQPAPDAAP